MLKRTYGLSLLGGTLRGPLIMLNSLFTPDSVKGIKGTTANDNAQAGSVGEYIESIIPNPSEIALTTSVAKDITSIVLTAGDWDVWGTAGFDNGSGSTAWSLMLAWISSTSATAPVAPNAGAYVRLSYPLTGNEIISPVGMRRFSLNVTTTIYLSVFATFTNTAFGFGSIHARRAR